MESQEDVASGYGKIIAFAVHCACVGARSEAVHFPEAYGFRKELTTHGSTIYGEERKTIKKH